MSSIKQYFSDLGSGIVSLLKGMQVTGKEFVTPKITERYPEDRLERHVPERFRATLQFIYPDPEHYRCTACGVCERNCPNGTIHIESEMVEGPDGKKRKQLNKYLYDLGSCTFCQLCVSTCPSNAIEFSNDFEQAVFTRAKLVKQLNRPGTSLLPRPAVPKSAAAPAAAPKAAAPAGEGAPKADPQAAARARAQALMATDPEKAKKILEALDKAAAKAPAAAPAPAPAAPAAKPDPQAAARARAEALMATDPEKAKKILEALDKAAKAKGQA